jgi:hypothetical protein
MAKRSLLFAPITFDHTGHLPNIESPPPRVIQSTWLEDFFARGAGMMDNIQFAPFKKIADWFLCLFINFWIRYGFMNPGNKAASHFGVKGYRSIFDYWRGDISLVAEPTAFTGMKLPPNLYSTGPLIARQNFPLPDEVKNILQEKPILCFAMGSSGPPETIAKISVGMQPRQAANIASLVRRGFSIRVPKSKDPSKKVQQAIQLLLNNKDAIRKAKEFSKIMEKWDSPKLAADLLFEKFGDEDEITSQPTTPDFQARQKSRVGP